MTTTKRRNDETAGTRTATRRSPARGGTRRADAERNRRAILAATPIALQQDSDASVADIAAAAGVGRMTLYGHFATRAELIEAALIDSLEQGDALLSDVPLDGDAAAALSRLVAASWALVDRSRALLAAGQKELSSARVRELHEKAEARMRALIERGQREGSFRRDLPVVWLLSTAHALMNGAAADAAAGRLDPADAAGQIDAVLQPALAPPLRERAS